jgi:hypothetical protein
VLELSFNPHVCGSMLSLVKYSSQLSPNSSAG